MGVIDSFEFDLGKKFPFLPNAPIVEAVIHWQAAPRVKHSPDILQKELETRFPDFTTKKQQEFKAEISGTAEGVELHHQAVWDGFRLTSPDGKHICQFKPSAVVFSRLKPYLGWEQFYAEAEKFWRAYVELSDVDSVERLGVRYISQICLEEGQKASDFINDVPQPLQQIGVFSDSFFHQDLLKLKNAQFQVNLIRAMPAQAFPGGRTLIVDIDVSTVTSISPDSKNIGQQLAKMRFIKNEVFFMFMKNAEENFK